VEILTGCVAGPGEGEGLALGEGLGDMPGLGEGLGLGDVPGLAEGLGLGEGVMPPNTLMVALALLRASSMWKVPDTQKVNENDWPGSRSSLSRKLWFRSRTRARLLPILVQVTRVPAFTVSRLGLKGPPPPVIATLEIAIGSQVGWGLGLGEGLGLCPGLGDGLGLWPGLGDGLGLWPGDGLGEGLEPPPTVMVALALLRASSMRKVPDTQKVNEND
jgi:hypothetical protein